MWQKPGSGIDSDHDSARPEATEDGAGEAAGAAAQLDHAVVRLQVEFVQQLFRWLGEVRVLDFQPAGGAVTGEPPGLVLFEPGVLGEPGGAGAPWIDPLGVAPSSWSEVSGRVKRPADLARSSKRLCAQ